jgi:hypothetical protein
MNIGGLARAVATAIGLIDPRAVLKPTTTNRSLVTTDFESEITIVSTELVMNLVME